MLRHLDYNNRLISIVSLFSGTLCISTLMATLQNDQVYEGLSKEEHIVSLCEDLSPPSGASSFMRRTTPSERKSYEK